MATINPFLKRTKCTLTRSGGGGVKHMGTHSKYINPPNGSVVSWLSRRLTDVSSSACEKMPSGTLVMLLCSTLSELILCKWEGSTIGKFVNEFLLNWMAVFFWTRPKSASCEGV